MSFTDFDKSSLILPMDGANNATVAADYSLNAKTLVFNGNAKISTAQSLYYGSSLALDGSGDYLYLSNVADLRFGTGDFTVSGYVYNTNRPGGGVNNDQTLYGTLSGTGYMFIYLDNTTGSLVLWDGTTSKIGGVVPLNTWTHFAMCRQASMLYAFVGGVLGSAGTSYTFNQSNTTETIKIGGNAGNLGNRYLWGYLQDILVIKGVGLWTSDFTPPPRLIGETTGNVLDEAGAPVQRTVISVPRTYPSRVFAVQSDVSTGNYTLRSPSVDSNIIALHQGTPQRDDLIARVTPA